MFFPLSCSLCSMGLLQSAFPPAAWWALIAAAWFLTLSASREAPRGIPRLVIAILLVFVLTILAMAVTGHVLFLFLLAWCALAVALEFLVPRKADVRRDRRFVLWATGLAGLSLVVTAGLTYYRMSNMTPVELVTRTAGWGGPGVEIEVARVARRTVNPEQDFKAILESTDNGRVAKAVARHLACNESDTDCMLILVDAVESMDDHGYPTADARTKLRTLSGLDLASDATAQDWRDALTVAP